MSIRLLIRRVAGICLLIGSFALPVAVAAHCGFCEDAHESKSVANLEGDFDHVKSLKEQINLYNLLNGLQLARSQILDILKLAEEADRLRRAQFSTPHQAVKEAEVTFSDVLKHLEKGRFAPKELELMAHARETRLMRLRRDYFAKLNALEAKAWEILTPAQRVIVRDYRECLIPEADLKNPVNLGQAEASGQMVDLLTRVQALPEAGADAAIDKVIAELFVMMDKKLRLTALGAADQEKARIKAVLLRVRGMSPIDFELQKADLAKEAKPRFVDQLHREADQFQERMQKVVGGVSKIGKQLLHPKVIPILRSRLTAPTAVCDLTPAEQKSKAELLSTLNREGKPAPSADKVAAFLGLDVKARAVFVETIVAFQKRAFRILMTQNDQGVSPFLTMMRAKAGGLPPQEGAALLHQAFVETFPGKTHSYFEELINEKLKTYSDIRRTMNEREFARLSDLDVDLMDLRTGFEMGRGSMGEGSDGEGAGELGEEPNLVALIRHLQLDRELGEKMHAVLTEHQKDIVKLFRQGEPGKTPFDALVKVFQSQGDKESLAAFLTTLQSRVASGTDTYFEIMLDRNRETWRRLEKVMPADAYAALAHLGLDLMKVKTGFNPLTGEGCTWEELEYIEKGERMRQKHRIEKKTTVGELFTIMSVQDAKVRDQVVKVLQEGQKKAFELLSQPGMSGEAPIDQLKFTGGAEGMKVFFQVLMGKVKGRETTFMQELEKIKRDTFVKLKTVLPNAAYQLFRSLNLDLLDIDAGYNLGFEVMKRRVSNWW